MATYKELLAQKADLEKKIETARKQEIADAVAEIKRLMQQYGITVADLGGKRFTGRKGTVAPKYRDPATGTTWTGRGRQPAWVKAALKSGRKLQDLAV